MRPIALAQLILIAALVMGLAPLFYMLLQSGAAVQIDGSILGILGFTLKQAALSCLLSVVMGLAIARALARQEFKGRSLMLVLFGLPMVVPSIVAVLGTLVLFGNAGLMAGRVSPYGLAGILFVHVFFNLPLATRLFYQALQAAPQEGYKLAALLGFSNRATFAHVEWPVLKVLLPQVAAIVFLLCASSFVVVLTLGGASSTTLEVAIYQALRMDFDPPRALALSLMQIVLCATLFGFAQAAFKHDAGMSSIMRRQNRFAPLTPWARIGDGFLIILAGLIVIPPLGVILWRGVSHLHFNARVPEALLTSLGLGMISACATMLLAWPLAKAQSVSARLLSLSGLIVPPAVIATGWFLLLFRLGNSLALTCAFIIALNSLMALPYAVAALRGGQMQLLPFSRLQSQLGILGLAGFRIIEWPLMRAYAAQALLMALVLSLGDLSAITLLGSGGIITLPSLLYDEMAHYRGAQAEGTALILLTLCAALTFAAQRMGRLDA